MKQADNYRTGYVNTYYTRPICMRRYKVNWVQRLLYAQPENHKQSDKYYNNYESKEKNMHTPL
jgi:hypothetical protein